MTEKSVPKTILSQITSTRRGWFWFNVIMMATAIIAAMGLSLLALITAYSPFWDILDTIELTDCQAILAEDCEMTPLQVTGYLIMHKVPQFLMPIAGVWLLGAFFRYAWIKICSSQC